MNCPLRALRAAAVPTGRDAVCGGLLPFGLYMVLCFLSHRRLKPPVAFCKQPHLNKPVIPARLCEKKYDPERSAGWRFFFQQTRRARP